MIDHKELISRLAKERSSRKQLEDIIQYQKRQLEEKEQTIAQLRLMRWSISSSIEDHRKSSNHLNNQDRSSNSPALDSPLLVEKSLETLHIYDHELEPVSSPISSTVHLHEDAATSNYMQNSENENERRIEKENAMSFFKKNESSSVESQSDESLLEKSFSRRKKTKRSLTPPRFWDQTFPDF
ncbi:hypothetical protein J3Q64DRAFT_1695735 [Phycomyces blakesleeanus]|uniref:DNA endonuclease activator Ctp1 C-terminal domain-containing protein n=2 Tax=Phycomyces blakesleeanus TaxID=4837 RepID=A0A167QYU2_PHYB8|nr:hypothetical protein PHYBLDRAFT_161133 [Phycomyces blakesleeanus NRRL 1555(-)]OAD80487.1 hypothetical protein PHYBLDRAFT_161133 [Phycomyces blakesleeanus NRRL 1555(-)]|eukprot:XP_018298527.1 hypothetical protein PHYBLDRAFT_161133 [Phycomyces blakesleeanus NRRL 1555(-)]